MLTVVWLFAINASNLTAWFSHLLSNSVETKDDFRAGSGSQPPSASYLCVPSWPSQPQEGLCSPRRWCYLCAPHLRPPLCRNLARPTKGSCWCTTVYGATSVSVGEWWTRRHISPVELQSSRGRRCLPLFGGFICKSQKVSVGCLIGSVV